MNTSNAVESIRRLAMQYQGMIEAADTLEALGSLEQATDEAKAAQAKASSELAALTTDIQKANAYLVDLQNEASRVIEISKAQAESIINAASIEADSRVQASIVAAQAAGEARFKEIVAPAEDKAIAAADEYIKTTYLLGVAKADLAQVDADINAKQGQLDDLTRSLEALKAKLG